MKALALSLFFCAFVSLSFGVYRVNPQLADRYIIVFQNDFLDLAKHFELMPPGATVIDTFKIGTMRGYFAQLSKSALSALNVRPEVAYIEADQEVHIAQSCSSQSGATWGLNRIDERTVALDGIFNYDTSAGEGVDSYIVDTGILLTHDEFEGRAIFGANFVDNNNNDCNGHGTHVAGTVGGATYGVAKKTTLLAVKVLNCGGSGSWSGVISGIEFVLTSYQSRRRPSVANMSLGGGQSDAIDDAVAAAVAGGVTFVVAAGNSNADACNFSPAATPTAITVGATTIEDNEGTQEDTRSYFSNYGTCVDIFAPGQMITSAWIGSNTATNTISGTSMASPHVAGAVALLLGEDASLTPADIATQLSSSATLNLIEMDCASGNSACDASPNLLLYSAC